MPHSRLAPSVKLALPPKGTASGYYNLLPTFLGAGTHQCVRLQSDMPVVDVLSPHEKKDDDEKKRKKDQNKVMKHRF